MTTLTRIREIQTDPTDEEIENITGYKGLKAGYKKLVSDLISIGVCPFDPENVSAYCNRMVAYKNATASSAAADRYGWKWERIDLDKYSEPVPKNVLAMAARIKKTFPDVTLKVDALVGKRVAADPFLVIERNNWVCHIAVWDEPTFSDIALD